MVRNRPPHRRQRQGNAEFDLDKAGQALVVRLAQRPDDFGRVGNYAAEKIIGRPPTILDNFSDEAKQRIGDLVSEAAKKIVTAEQTMSVNYKDKDLVDAFVNAIDTVISKGEKRGLQ